MTVEELTGVLKRADKPSEIYTTPDGSKLLLLPYGARVLGLFAPGSDENFYWTNPAFSSANTENLFGGENWCNSGGDRTWLAPEIDLSFPEFPDLNTYKVPGEIDPGKYQIERSGQSLRFVNQVKVQLFRSHQTIEVEISKSWHAAVLPLNYERVWSQITGVECAGYTQRTSLRLLGSDERGPVGAWNIIQLPHGGRALFPLHSDVQPTVYFGSIPPDDIETQNCITRYWMKAYGIQKIGIRASASTGRAGYLYSAGKRWVLVVRNVFVHPAAEYVDAPWTSSGELGERGVLFQACNVNSNLGCFSEMEYHAPAIGRGTGRIQHEDVSQVWAFRGSEESIRAIGQNLLPPAF